MLGIDTASGLYYEGMGLMGFGLWPSPVVTIATIESQFGVAEAESRSIQLEHARNVFREDSFDPVTRIRRGRLYTRTPEGRNTWRVRPHPAFPNEVVYGVDGAGWLPKTLASFNPLDVSTLNLGPHPHRNVVLGTGRARTYWMIVDIERIATGEELVTLKARSRLGILPELDEQKLPPLGSASITDTYDKAADAAYKLGSESTIDRCRDAASAMLGGWLAHTTQNAKDSHRDLNDVSDRVFAQNKRLAGHAGSLIALLHVRGKPNEQARHGFRRLSDEDAAAALACLGLIVRELGFEKD